MDGLNGNVAEKMGSPSHVGELMLKPRLEILGPGYLAFRIPKPKMISVWFLWRCWDGLKPHKSRWWSPSSSNNLCGGAITKARLRWTDSNVGRPPQAFWNQQILVFMVLWCFMVLDGIPYIYIFIYAHVSSQFHRHQSLNFSIWIPRWIWWTWA